MSIFQPIRDWLTGSGEGYSITVPVMDGPLKPNDRIEAAALIASLPGAGNLGLNGDRLIFSQGSRLMALTGGDISTLIEAGAEITAVAVCATGVIALGLAGQGVLLTEGSQPGRRIASAEGQALNCVTALAFLADGSLVIANGSKEVATKDWVHDLMGHGASGFVAYLGQGEPVIIARGLRYPAGLCQVSGQPDLIALTEAWRHRVLAVSLAQRAVTGVLIDELPGYPARITTTADGYLLSHFSIRSQLIEFVLREKRFLKRMREEVAPDYWIAPGLRSGDSFKEPLQSGGVIRLGIHKPWAPTRSYGLVTGLSPDFRPVWSAHSRAGGKRHGVTSAVAYQGGVAALSQGSGDLVRLETTQSEAGA